MAQLHILMIPLMSQSHIIPLTNFAVLLARRGALVSIVTTPLNAGRQKPIIDRVDLKIQLLPLRFPCREAGLPEGCENMDMLSSLDSVLQFFQACEMLKPPLHDLIQQLNPAPNCIISTSAMAWTQDLAGAFKIPRYVFETVSCFTLSCSKKAREAANAVDSDSEPFLVPDIPHRIHFTKNQLPRFGTKDIPISKKQQQAPTSASRGTLVNSFDEMEGWYLERLRQERGNVWSVGPVFLSNYGGNNNNDNNNNDKEHNCLKWLDSMKPKSVVYICFGSLCSVSLQQMKEIGLGLEESGAPFIWIIRKTESGSAGVEEWLAGERFEERVRGRGLVVRGWAPQVMILSHPSVGGFMTHCGWNSTLEGVSAGVPMITWPMFAEQFYNEKLIVNVLGVGVGVGVGVERYMPAQGLVGREGVKKAVKELMGESEEGRERRKRSEDLAKMAAHALEPGGSSFLNVDKFMQDVVKANSVVHA